MSKKWLAGLFVVAVMAFSVFSVALADDDSIVPFDTGDYGVVSMFSDGRLNAFDMAAPVAIYYTYQTVTDEDGSSSAVVSGIELLAIDQETNTGRLALAADLDALTQLTSGAVSGIEGGGFSLHYASGWFWVTATPDAEGKIYSFAWENQTIPVG